MTESQSNDNEQVPEWFEEKLKMAVRLYGYIDTDDKLIEDNDEYQHIADALNHVAHDDALLLSDEDYEFYALITQIIDDGDVDYSDVDHIDLEKAWQSYSRVKQDFEYLAKKMLGAREVQAIVEKARDINVNKPSQWMGSFSPN